MKPVKMITQCLLCFGLIGLQSMILPLHAQRNEQNEVRWIRSISPREPVKGKLPTRIWNTILGNDHYQVMGHPMSIWAVSQSELRITDQKSKTVWRYDINKGRMFRGIRSNMDFPSLVGICEMNKGDLAFTDSYLGKVFRLSTKGRVSEFTQSGAQLQQPTGIAWLAEKRQLWVVETGAHCISVFDENGKRIKRIGKRGTANLAFNYPTFIWIDREGMVYVVDAMNFRVQILSAEGSFISAFGEAGDSSGFLARPKGICTDSHGHIYLVDALFNTVQIFDRKGKFLYQFGSQGKEDGQLWLPTDIYIDEEDNIYVSDTYNSRIQVFKLIYHGQD